MLRAYIILDKILPYEAMAELCQIFRSFFGVSRKILFVTPLLSLGKNSLIYSYLHEDFHYILCSAIFLPLQGWFSEEPDISAYVCPTKKVDLNIWNGMLQPKYVIHEA